MNYLFVLFNFPVTFWEFSDTTCPTVLVSATTWVFYYFLLLLVGWFLKPGEWCPEPGFENRTIISVPGFALDFFFAVLSKALSNTFSWKNPCK